MYTPRGFGLSEVGDIEIFPLGDELHLFHLTLPNHDTVQHAVSTNGIEWTQVQDAIRTGDPGACDDDMIWTMSVSAHGGQYHMLYTALARAEDGRVQRTAHATSPDLYTWTKDPNNPVAEADARWYETDPTNANMVSWRDPKPVLVDGVWHAAVNARANSGPPMRRGAVGHFTSTDFETWEVQPPLFAPGRFWDLECPQVFSIDGLWYLTAACMEERLQRYWVSDSHLGPWRQPADGGILAPVGHYAGRMASWKGQPLFMCWHLPPGGQPDWTRQPNPAGKYVVAPLTLARWADGTLSLCSFAGWRELETGPAAALPSPGESRYRNAAVDGWNLSTNTGELDLVATPETYEDFRLSGRLTVDAPVGGFGFRLEGDSGGGYFVEIEEGSDTVSLQRWLGAAEGRSGRPWFTWSKLQQGRLRRPFVPGTTLDLHVIVNGPYIEVSLGGEVVLSVLSAKRTTGEIGIWCESGTVALDAPTITPLRKPEHR